MKRLSFLLVLVLLLMPFQEGLSQTKQKITIDNQEFNIPKSYAEFDSVYTVLKRSALTKSIIEGGSLSIAQLPYLKSAGSERIDSLPFKYLEYNSKIKPSFLDSVVNRISFTYNNSFKVLEEIETLFRLIPNSCELNFYKGKAINCILESNVSMERDFLKDILMGAYQNISIDTMKMIEEGIKAFNSAAESNCDLKGSFMYEGKYSIYQELGYLYFCKKDYQTSLKYFDNAIAEKVNPIYPLVLKSLVYDNMYEETNSLIENNLESAFEEIKRDKNQKYYYPKMLFYDIYTRSMDLTTQDSIALLENLVRERESYNDILSGELVKMYVADGNYQSAQQFSEQVYRSTNLPVFLSVSALFNFSTLNNFKKAKLEFEELTKKHPDFIQGFYNYGLYYIGMDDKKNAQEMLKKLKTKENSEELCQQLQELIDNHKEPVYINWVQLSFCLDSYNEYNDHCLSQLRINVNNQKKVKIKKVDFKLSIILPNGTSLYQKKHSINVNLDSGEQLDYDLKFANKIIIPSDLVEASDLTFQFEVISVK